jgi:hypothetical protein
MDTQFCRARFYVPGPSTATRIREAIALIEFRYNLSAWLYGDLSNFDWEELTRSFVRLFSAVPIALKSTAPWNNEADTEFESALQDVSLAHLIVSFDNRQVALGNATLESRIEIIESLNFRLVSLSRMSEEMQLNITGIRPVGSVNIGTEGLGEPLKEVVRSVWSRKERAEARRHTEITNQQDERDADLDYHIKRTNHVLDSITRIHDMMQAGLISTDQGQEMISSLVGAQRAANVAIMESDVQYVDRTLREVES